MEHSSRKNNILVILFRDKNKRRLIKPPNIVLCIIHQYLTNAFNLMYDFSHNETWFILIKFMKININSIAFNKLYILN